TGKARGAGANGREGSEPDGKGEVTAETDLDLSVGVDPKSQDPVRVYLREMSSVPLLNREGEVVIAKRIERGHLVVMKTVSRLPIVIKEIVTIGESLRRGVRCIKEIIQLDDEELTDEKREDKTKKTLRQNGKITELYNTSLRQMEKLAKTPKSKRQSYLRVKWGLGRPRIQISLAIRVISFHWMEKKRL